MIPGSGCIAPNAARARLTHSSAITKFSKGPKSGAAEDDGAEEEEEEGEEEEEEEEGNDN